MAKRKIEPNIVLTLNSNDMFDVKMVLRDGIGNILELRSVSKLPKMHITRRNVVNVINELLQVYEIDTIILEEVKLFLDRIDKYPDPYVLQNVCLGYGLRVAIEDNFYNRIKYIMEYSRYEWRKYILGNNKYGIDLFKNHILLSNVLSEADIEKLDEGRFYEVLCMSEIVRHNSLLNKKYQINID